MRSARGSRHYCAMSTASRPYLNSVRDAVTKAMCIRNLPCQLVRRGAVGSVREGGRAHARLLAPPLTQPFTPRLNAKTSRRLNTTCTQS
jgi:hypothetical protein